MEEQLVGGVPISKLKENFAAIEIFSEFEFYDMAKRKDLNPAEIIYRDLQKLYFYNDKMCYYYFFNSIEYRREE